MQLPINPIEITAEEIANLRAEAASDGIGGWTENSAEHEVEVLKKELAKKDEQLAAAKAGMSQVSLADKVEHLYQTLGKKVAAGDKWDIEDITAVELMNLQAREEAKALHAASKTQSGYKTLDIQPLAELLKEDDAPLEWRINGFMQKGHNVTMAARYKVGKTTFVTNLLRSLVDGDPFLDIWTVTRVTKPIVVFNHELSDRQFTAWLRKAGIKNTHMIIPVNLRGKGLYLQDEDAQDWAIELLKKYEAEVWIIDPLQAALRGSVNDDNVASDWIAAADRVKAESGVSELLLVTHTGHLSKADEYGRSANERSAGSSRWAGWPDALWSYTMDDEGVRYISAEGRDVSIEENGLMYDEETGHLKSMGTGSGRVDTKINGPFKKVMGLFKPDLNAVMSRPEIATATRFNNKKITDAIQEAVASDMLIKCDAPKVEGKGRGRTADYYCLTPQGRYYVNHITD